jgi:hypothetical protein
MLRAYLFAVVFVAAMLPLNAHSQQTNGGQLEVFTSSSYYQGLLNGALNAMPPAIFKRCPTLVSNRSKVTILESVSFGTDGTPNGGMWKQSFPVSGCGNDTTINLYFYASANEKIDTAIGMPGDTHADLKLQRDTVFYTKLTAHQLIKDCPALLPINSTFAGYGLLDPTVPDPGPASTVRPWHEEWTLVGCGHKVNELVDFVPQQVGTSIMVPMGGATVQ